MMRLVFFLLIFFFILSCKPTQEFSYKIIRYNYFDSSYYSMNQIDTNKIDRNLYKNIFTKIRFDTSAKCLLLKVFSNSVVWEEYGLYDYITKKYYYTSIEENQLYFFNEPTTKKSKQMYEKMKEYIDDPVASFNSKHNKRLLLDGNNFELSLISVNTKNEILVRSFHW